MLKRILRLSPAQRRLGLELAGSWALAKAGLCFLSPKRLISRREIPPRPESDASRAALSQTLRGAEAFFRDWPFKASCLERSLALLWMLRRRGYPVRLKIGLSKKSSGLEAHAWLELGGVVLNDEPGIACRYAASLSPGETV